MLRLAGFLIAALLASIPFSASADQHAGQSDDSQNAPRNAPRNDLWQIYQTALIRDAAYAAAGYDYRSLKINRALARTAFSPTISLRGTAERIDEQDGGSDDTAQRGSLQADWRVFDLEAIRTFRQAKLQVEGAKIQYDDARADLILRVADAYFQVLAARDNKRVAQRQQSAITRQMELSREMLEVGLGTRTDLFESQARLQQASADVIVADNRIDNAIQSIKQIIGETPRDLAALADDAPLIAPTDSAADWANRALQNNRALKIEDLNVEAAAVEVKKQRAVRMPNIDLNITRNWRESNAAQGANTQAGQSDSTSTLATLNWRLFQGGASFLRTKQAALRYNAAAQLREQVKRRIESETTSTYLAVVSGASQVAALADAVRAGEDALRAKREGFRAGLTANLDVLDAERDLAVSRTNHLAARYQFILSLLRLERAVGDLDEMDVQRINGWLVGG